MEFTENQQEIDYSRIEKAIYFIEQKSITKNVIV